MERLKARKTNTVILLFLLSFIVGSLCVYFTILELIIPLVIVFVYSMGLFFIAKSEYSTLSSFEKNTPYYLGFLFSLFSLFSLSLKSGFSFDSTSLLTSMSIALSTTILGLIMRQVLLSMSATPSEDYFELLNQIQSQTQNLQEAFLQVKNHVSNTLNEFENFKKTVHEKDNKGTSQSIEKLRQNIFFGLEGTFSEKIKNVLDSVSDFYIEDHETTIGQILPDSYKVEIAERLDDFHREVMSSLKKNTEEFTASLSQLSLQLKNDFQEKNTEDQIIRVNKMIRSYEEDLKSLSTSLEKKLSHPGK